MERSELLLMSKKFMSVTTVIHIYILMLHGISLCKSEVVSCILYLDFV